MAEENATAAASAATETETAAQGVEAARTESATELRDSLIAKLKERDKGGETETDPKKKPADTRKPKRGEADPKAATDADPDAANTADTPEIAKIKAERRGFAKHKRKWESQAQSREQQIIAFEQRSKQQIEAFERDPLAWLKGNKVDVRAALLRMANDDAEDPRDKKLRELDEGQKKDKAEREREKRETAERTAATEQVHANQVIEAECLKAWKTAEVEDYPTVAALLEPEHVAERAREIMVEDFRRWRDRRDRGESVGRYKELAPSDLFSTMERELAPLKGKVVNGKKGPKPPEQVRSASGKRREAENPEARTERQRPSEDVNRRVTREPSAGRPLSFDRESLRERLVSKAREVMR